MKVWTSFTLQTSQSVHEPKSHRSYWVCLTKEWTRISASLTFSLNALINWTLITSTLLFEHSTSISAGSALLVNINEKTFQLFYFCSLVFLTSMWQITSCHEVFSYLLEMAAACSCKGSFDWTLGSLKEQLWIWIKLRFVCVCLELEPLTHPKHPSASPTLCFSIVRAISLHTHTHSHWHTHTILGCFTAFLAWMAV